jgi:hypothetical protein
MGLEDVVRRLEELKSRLDSLECRFEALEKVVGKANVRLNVEVPKVILEKKPLDIRIGEDELLGRILLLVKEGFFDGGRAASEVANELIRRCWHPKDLQHIRPTLEQLTALRILDRIKEKKQKGKGLKWVYKKKGKTQKFWRSQNNQQLTHLVKFKGFWCFKV